MHFLLFLSLIFGVVFSWNCVKCYRDDGEHFGVVFDMLSQPQFSKYFVKSCQMSTVTMEHFGAASFMTRWAGKYPKIFVKSMENTSASFLTFCANHNTLKSSWNRWRTLRRRLTCWARPPQYPEIFVKSMENISASFDMLSPAATIPWKLREIDRFWHVELIDRKHLASALFWHVKLATIPSIFRE